jgi:hypothetical protein
MTHQREDLRYGDPHLHRGKHLYYGPDKFDMEALKEPLPALESHGFYLAGGKPPGFWRILKSRLFQT